MTYEYDDLCGKPFVQRKSAGVGSKRPGQRSSAVAQVNSDALIRGAGALTAAPRL